MTDTKPSHTPEPERPWWFPVLTDSEWIARIRSYYPEDTAGMGDSEIRESYAHGCKYADVWDHVGDARESWEHLADAFMELVEVVERLEANLTGPFTEDGHSPYFAIGEDEAFGLSATLAKVKGEK